MRKWANWGSLRSCRRSRHWSSCRSWHWSDRWCGRRRWSRSFSWAWSWRNLRRDLGVCRRVSVWARCKLRRRSAFGFDKRRSRRDSWRRWSRWGHRLGHIRRSLSWWRWGWSSKSLESRSYSCRSDIGRGVCRVGCRRGRFNSIRAGCL